MLIREATSGDAAAVGRVHVESWRAAYRGIVPDSYLETLSEERAAERWERLLDAEHGLGFTYLAEDEGRRVVGFANAGPERTGHAVYRGELYAIYLLPGAQRQGLGRRLVSVVASRLLRMNLDTMLVWVMEKNPANYFYEALGGRKVGTDEIERDGVRLPLVAYGWTDVRALARDEA